MLTAHDFQPGDLICVENARTSGHKNNTYIILSTIAEDYAQVLVVNSSLFEQLDIVKISVGGARKLQ